MKTKLTRKGQVVIPTAIRRELGLRPGDSLEIVVRNGQVTLTPRRMRRRKASILTDHITGLPVLSAGPASHPLTSEQVQEMLADFP